MYGTIDLNCLIGYSVFQVKSLSQLYRDADTFIASSTEQGSKRNLSNPSSNSSNHSGSPPQRNRFQKSKKKPREESTGMWLNTLTVGFLHFYLDAVK